MVGHSDTSTQDFARQRIRRMLTDSMRDAVEARQRIERDGLTTPISGQYLAHVATFIPEMRAVIDAVDALWAPSPALMCRHGNESEMCTDEWCYLRARRL